MNLGWPCLSFQPRGYSGGDCDGFQLGGQEDWTTSALCIGILLSHHEHGNSTGEREITNGMYKSMIKPGMKMKSVMGDVMSNKTGKEGLLEEAASEQKPEKDECECQGNV